MMRLRLILSLAFFSFSSLAQDVPSITPQFFGPDEDITISYNVTGTSLAGLSEAYIWMWLPDESIDAPSNINPAASNASATAPAKFTKTNEQGQTIFRITLTPTAFFNQPAEKIVKLGMILKGNDWSDGQTSDYIQEVSTGFAASLISPVGNYGFYDGGESIDIDFAASASSTITFSVDGELQSSIEDATSFTAIHDVIADGQTHLLAVTADNGTEQVTKNYSYTTTPVVTIAAIPSTAKDGINYNSQTSATLVLVAPQKENVFVIGDFNNWSLDNDYLMKKDGDKFWLTINNLEPGKEYQFQYLVDGAIKIADPYATKIGSEFDDNEIVAENRYPNLKLYPNTQTSEAVSFLQTDKQPFNWTDDSFSKPAKEELVIYELLIRDFTDMRTIAAVQGRLDYLQELGINAIELMPVMEFEGNLSWGYNPFAMLAFDKYYGTETDLKTFVNECHTRGIAVILDIALNHQFGRNSLVRLYNEGLYGNPTAANPWFNTSAKHDFNVGYDMNHESELTQNYVDRVVSFWLEEYHVDGYRYDLSKGFTQKNTLGNVGLWGQYDASRVALLKRLADHQWSVDEDSYVILEHFADNTEEKELANYGMMLWGNHNDDFKNLAKGSNRNITNMLYESRGYNEPHLINYMESHDEERVAFELDKSSSSSLAIQMQRLKLNAAFFFMVPGPKMLWQFGEFGYDEELNNDRLGVKPTKWEYLENDARQSLFQVYQSLIKLKTRTEFLNKDNFGWSAGSSIKWLRYNDQDTEFVLTGNFGNTSAALDQQIISEGTWYDYFTGNEIEIVASDDFSFKLSAGEFRLLTSKPIENYIDDALQKNIVLANTTTGVNQIMAIHPNPALNTLYISTYQPIEQVEVFDLQGSKQFNFEVKNDNGRRAIDVSQLPNGLYILRVKVQGDYLSEKFIVKH